MPVAWCSVHCRTSGKVRQAGVLYLARMLWWLPGIAPACSLVHPSWVWQVRLAVHHFSGLPLRRAHHRYLRARLRQARHARIRRADPGARHNTRRPTPAPAPCRAHGTQGRRPAPKFCALLQRKERDHGVETLTHQKWSGAELMDTQLKIATGGTASTLAMGAGVTEDQFGAKH